MRKILIIFILLLFTCHPSLAQETKVKATSASPSVTQEQQAQVAQALADAERAQLAADAADARRDLAKTRAQALIFSIMATLKISPEEYRYGFTKEGNLQFERIPERDPAVP